MCHVDDVRPRMATSLANQNGLVIYLKDFMNTWDTIICILNLIIDVENKLNCKWFSQLPQAVAQKLEFEFDAFINRKLVWILKLMTDPKF